MNMHANPASGAALTGGAFDLWALERMIRIRAFEATALAMSQSNPPAVVGSIHLCAGQEAIPVGARAALEADDQVIATYRGHGWALESGVTASELLHEIAHRRDGINGGRAGSAMVMAPDRGFTGENSIVGAGGPIATGVALAFQRTRRDNVVVVSFGDGAMSQGALHEAMVFAMAEKLPVIFVCENNGWAEMTRSNAKVKVDNLSKRAHGYGMPAATINGNDPVVVRDSIRMAATRARAGDGPCLIECKTARLWGHYNRDIEHYRDKEDRQRAVEADPITALEAKLIGQGTVTAAEIAALKTRVDDEMAALSARVIAAPLPNPMTARDHVVAETRPLPRPAGAGAAEEMTYAQAANAALADLLESDPNVIIYGEDVGRAGGIFGVTRNLQRAHGEARVFDTPIAEAAILGSAVGASMHGLRPIVEIMWADFVFVALDTLVNQAANVRYITSGRSSAPMVVRMQQGTTPGSCAQHSQSIEAMLAHVPGLKVVLPTTPQDVYDALIAAGSGDDPTIVIESRVFYQQKGPVARGGGAGAFTGAMLRRRGADVALIGWGTAMPHVLAAADILAAEGIEAAVLDLRSLSPIDDAAIDTVVAASGGRVVVVHEANLTGGFGAEIAARVTERHFGALKAPVKRVGTPDIRMPAAPALQQALLPTAHVIADAARDLSA